MKVFVEQKCAKILSQLSNTVFRLGIAQVQWLNLQQGDGELGAFFVVRCGRKDGALFQQQQHALDRAESAGKMQRMQLVRRHWRCTGATDE